MQEIVKASTGTDAMILRIEFWVRRKKADRNLIPFVKERILRAGEKLLLPSFKVKLEPDVWDRRAPLVEFMGCRGMV